MSGGLLRAATQGTAAFDTALRELAHRGQTDLERVEGSVREILTSVRRDGDAGVLSAIERFEQRRPQQLLLRDYEGDSALCGLEPDVRDALTQAAQRIRRYHERQRAALGGFEYEEDGVLLGSRVTPLERVGIYAPGGKARYPSSVLMCAVVAQVAGVTEVIVASPDPGPEVRAACALAGVHAILDAGGAQAVAALAYGTASVPRVDKIVGPGNIYVACAKRLVFGEVDIDSIAGPSEILVIADESADVALLAADLLSQAEHDEAAYPLLLTNHAALLGPLARELERQLAALPRRSVAEPALRNNGQALVVDSRAELARVADLLAAEHVAIHTREPRELADRIKRAGALFIGSSTPEAAGDYLAGPSHVLPTGGAARYAAPLGVYDFVSRSSLIEYQPQALRDQAQAISAFARAEGLEAHARAVEIRTKRPS